MHEPYNILARLCNLLTWIVSKYSGPLSGENVQIFTGHDVRALQLFVRLIIGGDLDFKMPSEPGNQIV